MPVATAIAACSTVPAAAPPPWGTRLKNVRSPMPTFRATSISSLESIVKVTMPSTSLGRSPASSIAALTASQASWSSVRPDSFENSVWPMPAIAAALPPVPRCDPHALAFGSRSEQADRRRPRHVVAEAVAALERDLDEALAVGALGLTRDAAGEPVDRSGTRARRDRIASLVTIASGPAQSVRKRVHSPLVVRMFMKMLGDPCFLANSGSWWTGMKSRDAIAPATITVAVTGISSGVTSSPTLMSRQSRVVVRGF